MNFKRSDYRLMLVYIFLSACLIARSFYDPNGFLSPDSTDMLQVAKQLLQGNGLFYFDFINHNGEVFFAKWPLAYPFLIFLVAKISGLSVFWASKILNLMLLGMNLLILRKIIGRQTYVFAILLFSYSFIIIFSTTWTENLFITALLWFAYSTYVFQEKNSGFINASWLFLAALLMFMSRYIGLISAGILGILLILNLGQKQFRKSFWLGGMILLLVAFAATYLWHNIQANGYMAGMPRQSAHEGFLIIAKQIIRGQVQEFIPFDMPSKFIFSIIFLAFELVVLFFLTFYLIRKKYLQFTRSIPIKAIYLITIGLIYWVAIVSMRFITHFDHLNLRFLAPASMLLFAGVFVYLQSSLKKSIHFRTAYFIGLLLFVGFLASPYARFIKDRIFYKEHQFQLKDYRYDRYMDQLKEKYADIPPHSVIAFGNIHLNYLIDDVYPSLPLHHPYYSKKESMDDYIRKAREFEAEHVYVEVFPVLSKDNFHSSVLEFMEQHKEKIFFKID